MFINFLKKGLADKIYGTTKVPFFDYLNDPLNEPQWVNNICGLYCLKMSLGAFFRDKNFEITELLHEGIKTGAYDEERGWIHKKLLKLGKEHGLKGFTKRIGTNYRELAELLDKGALIVASVSDQYREPEKGKRNGHLILIYSVEVESGQVKNVYFNDPGNKFYKGERNICLEVDIFSKVFSGNLVVLSAA